MLDQVRHNLRVIVRMAALLVLLGLGTVPVECAAVYGPHSIFISAAAVAEVRGGSHHHARGSASSASGMSFMAMPDRHAALHGTESSRTGSTRTGVTTSLPEAAGMTVDALIAVALFATDSGPEPSGHAVVSRFTPPLADNLPPAPEPPPPRCRS